MARKVFISHSYKDRQYADVFVKLLKDFGFREEDIFYSSSPETGVRTGELIFDRLKKELEECPIVLYFLSNNYYASVPCLNEMGASWMMTDDHFPIALPDFSPDEITGAINHDRLALRLKEDFDEMNLYHLINQLCEKAKVNIPSVVDYHKDEYIRPIYEQVQELIRQEAFLVPNEEGVFETILVAERENKGVLEETHDCFKLPKMIVPTCLGLEESTEEEHHWLLFFKSKVTYKVNDKVKFKLSKKQPEKSYTYEGISNCRNIYVYDLEKIK